MHNIQVTVTATGIAQFTYCTVIPCTLCTEIFCNDVHIIGPSSSVCGGGGGLGRCFYTNIAIDNYVNFGPMQQLLLLA